MYESFCMLGLCIGLLVAVMVEERGRKSKVRGIRVGSFLNRSVKSGHVIALFAKRMVHYYVSSITEG